MGDRAAVVVRDLTGDHCWQGKFMTQLPITVVIPVKNEAENLPDVWPRWMALLKSWSPIRRAPTGPRR